MIYIALLHHPVTNKHGDIVTTSVTNFDLHDLSRSAKTYGVESCFIVTPSTAQQGMADFIKNYWREGFGSEYNPDRKDAFGILQVSSSLSETCLTIKKRHGTPPKLIATSARKSKKVISFKALKQMMADDSAPYLVVFGTGWGLAESVMDQMDYILEPIYGPSCYNHLSVRAAVAIALDRLFGRTVTGEQQ